MHNAMRERIFVVAVKLYVKLGPGGGEERVGGEVERRVFQRLN